MSCDGDSVQDLPDVLDAARSLVQSLGPLLTGTLAGLREYESLAEAVRSAELDVDPLVEQRLLVGAEVLAELVSREGLEVARWWFTAGNARLDHRTPLTAIREDSYSDVRAAANALIEDQSPQ